MVWFHGPDNDPLQDHLPFVLCRLWRVCQGIHEGWTSAFLSVFHPYSVISRALSWSIGVYPLDLLLAPSSHSARCRVTRQASRSPALTTAPSPRSSFKKGRLPKSARIFVSLKSKRMNPIRLMYLHRNTETQVSTKARHRARTRSVTLPPMHPSLSLRQTTSLYPVNRIPWTRMQLLRGRRQWQLTCLRYPRYATLRGRVGWISRCLPQAAGRMDASNAWMWSGISLVGNLHLQLGSRQLSLPLPQRKTILSLNWGGHGM